MSAIGIFLLELARVGVCVLDLGTGCRLVTLCELHGRHCRVCESTIISEAAGV